ncbi:MAG: fluoride efflux transporter CrcB [Chthoniobacteraceae bacterium]
MPTYLLVALGGALGSVARFWLSGLIADRFVTGFPLNTMVINITGSFVIMLIAGLGGPDSSFLIPPLWRNFLMVGLCGGFTTFSSFSLQTLELMRDREWLYAGLNIVGSVVLCLIGAWLGLVFAGFINHLKGH